MRRCGLSACVNKRGQSNDPHRDTGLAVSCSDDFDGRGLRPNPRPVASGHGHHFPPRARLAAVRPPPAGASAPVLIPTARTPPADAVLVAARCCIQAFHEIASIRGEVPAPHAHPAAICRPVYNIRRTYITLHSLLTSLLTATVESNSFFTCISANFDLADSWSQLQQPLTVETPKIANTRSSRPSRR